MKEVRKTLIYVAWSLGSAAAIGYYAGSRGWEWYSFLFVLTILVLINAGLWLWSMRK